MKALSFFLSLCLAIAVSMAGCGGGGGAAPDVGEWTADNFPPYIRRLTQFGERADWSHDGQRILFIEKTFGDVFEIEVATGVIRPMTRHYVHKGYARALYLSNGDILLSGSRSFSAENPVEARFRTAELWVLSRALDRPAVPLGGMALTLAYSHARVSEHVGEPGREVPSARGRVWAVVFAFVARCVQADGRPCTGRST